MVDVKFAIKWGFFGLLLAAFAFVFNNTFAPTSLPGYEILAAPAMFAVSFFSEETPFWPKLIIFLAGQFLVYFCLSLIYKKVSKLVRK